MTGIKLAGSLTLPPEIVGEATAILAKRGAGKTNTAKVIVENVLLHKLAQVIVLDPVGVWWGLRLQRDGKQAAWDIPVLGGPLGDLPIERRSGKLLAEVAVESGQSMVLDVTLLDSNSAMQEFVYEFCERLYTLKATAPSPTLLVLEEADEFAPQNVTGRQHTARMVGAVNRIVKRGRSRGLGVLSVTQRSAALNKNVLDQSDTLIVMRTPGPRDRKAIEGWIEASQAAGADEVIPSLAGLRTGEAWVWSPEHGLLKRVQVSKASTFDSSSTPKAGAQAERRELRPIDIDKLGKQMQATVERAKADDPKELRKRIAELERKLAEGVETPEPERVEVPVVDAETLDAIGIELRLAASAEVEQLQQAIRDAFDQVDYRVGRVLEEAMGKSPVEVPRPRPPATSPPPPPRPSKPAEPTYIEPPSNGSLGRGELKVMGVLAEYPEGRTQPELAFLAGYSQRASTISAILAKLRKKGYVEQGQPIRASAEGLAAVGGPRERPTGQALLDEWMRHPRMGDGGRKVLSALIDAYPEEMSFEDLCAVTGYSPEASTISALLSKLRKLGMIEPRGRRVKDEFMEAIRE